MTSFFLNNDENTLFQIILLKLVFKFNIILNFNIEEDRNTIIYIYLLLLFNKIYTIYFIAVYYYTNMNLILV